MTGITLKSPDGMYRAAGYEHVAIAGDFAYVAGQVARDEAGQLVGPNDAAAQAALIYANLGKILHLIGARPDQVVKINTILTDRADGPAVSAERVKFFGTHRPPHTGIIAGLGGPEVRVEVELVVYLGKDR